MRRDLDVKKEEGKWREVAVEYGGCKVDTTGARRIRSDAGMYCTALQ